MKDFINQIDEDIEFPCHNPLETEEERLRRQEWEISEAQHHNKLKNIRNKSSVSANLISYIFIVTLIIIFWGMFNGATVLELSTVLATAVTGGASSLLYRFKKTKILTPPKENTVISNSQPTDETDV